MTPTQCKTKRPNTKHERMESGKLPLAEPRLRTTLWSVRASAFELRQAVPYVYTSYVRGTCIRTLLLCCTEQKKKCMRGPPPHDAIKPRITSHSPFSPDILKKIKIHSSCEIEDFVETHLCKLCVILRSRVFTGCVILNAS